MNTRDVPSGTVVSFAQYRENHPKPRAQEPAKQTRWEAVDALDRATQDLPYRGDDGPAADDACAAGTWASRIVNGTAMADNGDALQFLVPLMSPRYVLLPRFEQLTGYTSAPDPKSPPTRAFLVRRCGCARR